LQPSPVVTLNRAVAAFFGVRGALLQKLGRHAEARVAWGRALALAKSPAKAAHIRMQID
jgi:RNA polymerase sigma-70 factor (ECF subfamily)